VDKAPDDGTIVEVRSVEVRPALEMDTRRIESGSEVGENERRNCEFLPISMPAVDGATGGDCLLMEFSVERERGREILKRTGDLRAGSSQLVAIEAAAVTKGFRNPNHRPERPIGDFKWQRWKREAILQDHGDVLEAECFMEREKDWTSDRRNGKTAPQESRMTGNSRIGDLVMLHNSSIEKSRNKKLDIRWLGPYRIREVKDNGFYVLAELDGAELRDSVAGNRLPRFFVRGFETIGEHRDGDEASRKGAGPSAELGDARDEGDEGDLEEPP